MARLSCLLGVIWAICVAPAVMGENLIVKNASFEDSILPTGESTLNGEGLDHWTSESGSGVGLWNVSDLTYFPGGAPDGVNVAYSYGPAISQTLSDVVVEEYTFKLTVKGSPILKLNASGRPRAVSEAQIRIQLMRISGMMLTRSPQSAS